MIQASDKVFAGSIPELYDTLLVPLIFEVYARDLAARVARFTPASVLEIAAGTGALTSALVSQLSAHCSIVASDLNQPMLDRAATKPELQGRVTFRQADALALPFDDSRFDLVVCQFGAMFFPDRIEGYRQARRVLKPGGRFVFNVWDKIGSNEFTDVVVQSLATIFPEDPPAFLARTPHGYHDVERIHADVKSAGFAEVSIATVGHVSKAPSPREPAIAFVQGTPTRNEIDARGGSLEQATDVATAALAARFGHGAIEGGISAHVITASG
jgi:ubiquinone/menaquinone biosynthesis C-methylase UbiE